MKIAHIIWSGNLGGAEKALFNLLSLFNKSSKHEHTAFFGQCSGGVYDLYKSNNYKIIGLNLKSNKQFWNCFKARKLLMEFDIHHFHSLDTTLLLGSMLSKSKKRIYTRRGGNPQKTFKKSLLNLINKIILKNFFDAYTGNTKHALDSALRIFNLPEKKGFVTYNPVNPAYVLNHSGDSSLGDKYNTADYDIVIGTSGIFKKLKRFDLLISAFHNMKTEKKLLLIIGDGPEKTNLGNLINSLHLDKNIIITGIVNNIYDYLDLVDIFVLPSDSSESFGNSLIEAMLMKKPCIIMNDGGGLKEHIINSRTGFIADNLEDLATKLSLLAGDKEMRTQIGEYGYNYIINKYTQDNALKCYENVYDRVLSNT